MEWDSASCDSRGQSGAVLHLLTRNLATRIFANLLSWYIVKLSSNNNVPAWLAFFHEYVSRITLDSMSDRFAMFGAGFHYLMHFGRNPRGVLVAIENENGAL